MKAKLRILAILLLSAVLLASCSSTIDEINDASQATEEPRLTGSQVYREPFNYVDPNPVYGDELNLMDGPYKLNRGGPDWFFPTEPGLPRVEKWNPLFPFEDLTPCEPG